MSKNASLSFLVTTLTFFCGPIGWVSGEDKNIAAPRVDVRSASLGKAIDYLKGRQNPNGSWSKKQEQEDLFNLTPLCTLALLESGVPTDDPCIQAALKYLRNRKDEKKYTKVVAISTMVFCRAEPEKDKALIEQNVAALIEHQYREGKDEGGWQYLVKSAPKHRSDPANAEWALMALDRAHAAGFKIDENVWPRAFEFWKKRQRPNGSWAYHPASRGTGSMTCAGISSVLLIKEKLDPQPAKIDDCLARGMKWLEQNYNIHRNPSRDQTYRRVFHFYYLYGLSRVATAQDKRLIAEHDWFREAREVLTKKQDQATGKWTDHMNPLTDTSFAMLILASGQ